jgi:hypothetical protein
MKKMVNTLFANRTGRLVLPVISVMAVAVMGAGMLHASHALDTSSENFKSALGSADSQPTTKSSACCVVSLDKTVITDSSDRHITATVTVHNNTNATLQIAPGLQMSLVDATGTVHPYTAVYLPAGASVGGPLAASASRTEKLDFALGASDQPKLFVFQLDAATEPLIVGLPK